MIGTPEMLFSFITATRSRTVARAEIVIKPLQPHHTYSAYFTRLMLNGHTLMDDAQTASCAMAIARRASVTVSIAAEISGIFSEIALAIWDCRVTVRGSTVECPAAARRHRMSKLLQQCVT